MRDGWAEVCNDDGRPLGWYLRREGEFWRICEPMQQRDGSVRWRIGALWPGSNNGGQTLCGAGELLAAGVEMDEAMAEADARAWR